MGGQGNTSAYFLDYPNQKTSNLIHIYYFLNGGYLLTSVYSLLKSEKLPDFYENFLQHFCAMILVYFSYSHNLIRVGAIIMLCHDICEIFSSACRVFVDTSGQTEDILTRVTEIEEKEKIIEMKNK
ncbi:longevity-assurance (LAG1) protein [Plasmodium yoelii yoelii]|uniref:Longevity-assurance (LAG1) protein n=1 Tax=Plasmodium yoelii yoelii TaxID=73239 RepID=A0AAE9WQL4_PLAYO|nr:longevity-assurance (LAG1) protein [Plasmodium yoelii yoelii]